jgi:hypothetical protein
MPDLGEKPQEQFVMFSTIGGETVVVPKRGKHYIQPRGYAAMPGTGPEGETCGTCEFKSKRRRWLKCDHEFARRKHTHGRGSDILAGSPACKYWARTDWSRE